MRTRRIVSVIFEGFLGRDRIFSPKHFYKTHAGCRTTLLWLAAEKQHVKLHLFESSYLSGNALNFRPLTFHSQEELMEFLQSIQYTEEEISSIVSNHE